jgi:hypothetical protein
MRPSWWVLAGANALAAALLLNGGMAKLVSPAQLGRALGELLGRAGAPPRWVRGSAAVELAVAALLLAEPTRSTGALLTAVLAACFAVLGVAGLARGSDTPCGCFGQAGARPLGLINVLLGAALMLVYLLNAAASGVRLDGRHAPAAVLAASTATVVLCFWLNRRLVRQLLLPATNEVS